MDIFFGCFLFSLVPPAHTYPLPPSSSPALDKVSWLIYKANFGSCSSRDLHRPPLPLELHMGSQAESVKLPDRVRGSEDFCQVERDLRLQPPRLPVLTHQVSAPVPFHNLISYLLLCMILCVLLPQTLVKSLISDSTSLKTNCG